MDTHTDDIVRRAMRTAIDAARAVPRTLPNPRVGCVLLRPDGSQIAVGVHRGAGTPHAEVDALAQAGDEAKGATAVVTLEPCTHVGRTGPCTEALIDAGVARVVHAQTDPNPQAAGGADALRAAGLDVASGVLATDAEALNVEWTHAVTSGRPFVTWKYAATLDGRSAAPDGTSQWITGEEARRDVQLLRASADAVMAGTGTVLADDPHLTVRGADDRPVPAEQQPLRVIVGETTVPAGYHVHDRSAPTAFLRLSDPAEVLANLAEREIRHAWLEGGPRLAGAFWDAGLVDRVIAYLAPAVLGAGRSAVEGGAATLADLRRIDVHDVTTIGADLRIIGTPARSEPT